VNNRVPVAVSAFAVMSAAILSAWAWLVVAESTVPAGIGSDLEPVSKFQGLVIGPLLFIGLPIALFLLIPRIETRRHHLWSSAKAYGAIWIAVVLGGLVAHTAFVLRATNRSLDLSENILELVFPLLLIVTGNYLSKLRSNFFIGIRTPWTLSSDLAWRKTHRVGGRVLILLGLALIPFAFYLDSAISLWVTGVAVVGTALVLVVYSYFVWRSDPASRASERTTETSQQS
jgi:uncharacterized membrane protein